jgi:hypothetical protein
MNGRRAIQNSCFVMVRKCEVEPDVLFHYF